MYTSTLLTALSLSSIAFSTPITRRAETWAIPSMDIHFMGRDTGLPGNEWPESRKFNSTIDFAVTMPSGQVTCSANWKEHLVPTTPIACGEGLEFQLGPTAAGVLTEVNFVLSVKRTAVDTTSGVETTFVGRQEIRANDPGQPNSYLSCLGGPPLDGIRCKLSGWASTSSPLVLQADVLAQ